MIVPSVGRVIWYHAGQEPLGFSNPQPAVCAAIVAYVHSDSMVNLTVFDAVGIAHGRTSVPLVQDGDTVPSFPYCEWMPYQKGQAAKTEMFEKVLTDGQLAT